MLEIEYFFSSKKIISYVVSVQSIHYFETLCNSDNSRMYRFKC